SWSLLDYYRKPKPAYEVVRRLFEPLLISIDCAPQRFQAGDEIRPEVWIINDRAEPIPGCQVKVVLWNGTGQPVEHLILAVDVAADSAAVVGRRCWTLPEGGGWRLTGRLTQGSRVLASNAYDLSAYDGLEPTLGQRLWTWLTGWITPA
ncbi:hypothetical protein ACFLYD_05840, partial [Chloroflexota bacterium]